MNKCSNFQFKVNKSATYLKIIKHNIEPGQGLKFRTNINGNVSTALPVHVTIQDNTISTDWNIPYIPSNNNLQRINEVSRTMCLLKKHQEVEMSILLSTFSEKDISGSITIENIPNYIKHIDLEYSIDVPLGSPSIHYVDMTNETGFMIVEVSSEDDYCGMFSVHPLECPLKTNGPKSSNQKIPVLWQTMLRRGAFNINSEDFKNKDEKGLLLKFTTYESSELCGEMSIPNLGYRSTDNGKPLKSFSFKISKVPQYSDIMFAVTLSTLSILAVCVVLTIIMFYHIYTLTEYLKNGEKNYNIELSTAAIDIEDKEDNTDIVDKDPNVNQEITKANTEIPPSVDNDCNDYNVNQSLKIPKLDEKSQKKKDSIILSTIDDIETNGENTIPEISMPNTEPHDEMYKEKNSRTTYAQNELYSRLVVIVGAIFTVLAVQVLIKQQQYIGLSGDRDYCYFNYLCSIPIYMTNRLDFHHSVNYSFNHIFSNIGYVLFGIAFLFIVWYKERKWNSINLKEVKGIPQKFGIFYALGFALIFQGFLSSCYHACPTNENFQYDSTFMYVIAALLILKIYQLRHKDTLSASVTFLGITYIIIINHFSIANFQRALHIFTILYILFMLILTIIFYSEYEGLNLSFLVSFVKSFSKLFFQ